MLNKDDDDADDEFEVTESSDRTSFDVTIARRKLLTDAAKKEAELIASLCEETREERQLVEEQEKIQETEEENKELSADIISNVQEDIKVTDTTPLVCMHDGIEEGDEEEEARLEEEADMEAAQVACTAQVSRQELIDDWNAVGTLGPETTITTGKGTMLTYAKALLHFQNSEYVQEHIDDIVPTLTVGKGCLSWFINTTLKFPSALVQRDLVFCIAKCPYDGSNPTHDRMLQTIYKTLTGTSNDCAPSGPHWTDIGFQGNDPSTDLRGIGMLGLLLFLRLLEKDPVFTRRWYLSSRQEEYHFPLLCTSFNLTLCCLESLRMGTLYALSNTHSSVWKAMEELYMALAHQMFFTYKEKASSVPFPIVMQDVVSTGKRNPSKLVKLMNRLAQSGKLKDDVEDTLPKSTSNNSSNRSARYGAPSTEKTSVIKTNKRVSPNDPMVFTNVETLK